VITTHAWDEYAVTIAIVIGPSAKQKSEKQKLSDKDDLG